MSRVNAPPDHRRDLRDRLLVAEPVEPRHQRVVQRGGDRSSDAPDSRA
jgi:hypothetical protein